jgi:hypothetical protein
VCCTPKPHDHMIVYRTPQAQAPQPESYRALTNSRDAGHCAGPVFRNDA